VISSLYGSFPELDALIRDHEQKTAVLRIVAVAILTVLAVVVGTIIYVAAITGVLWTS
jgi:hypothetical protein